MSKFCGQCGKGLINGVCPACTNQTMDITQSSNNGNNFISPNEKLVCTLGNGFIQNFASGAGVTNTFSVISSKRVYFFGKIFLKNGKKIDRINLSKIFDLRDVTGTSVENLTTPSLIISGAIFFLLGFIFSSIGRANYFDPLLYGGYAVIVLGIISIIRFFLTRKTLLTIESAGGNIAFDIKWFSNQECENYQKMLRLAKDKVIDDTNHLTVEAIDKLIYSLTEKEETHAN